jgi:hypothetical protein
MKWTLVDSKGNLVEELAGKPTVLDAGFSLVCEETIKTKVGKGNFHLAIDGAIGTVDMDERVMHFDNYLRIEGTNLSAIESVRQHLKKKIGVVVESL